MKYNSLGFALASILTAAPASAFESASAERDEARLRIELEAAAPRAAGFRALRSGTFAEAARRDAMPEEKARKEDTAKGREAKSWNPIALLRW